MTLKNCNLFSHFDASLEKIGNKPILILDDGTTYDYEAIQNKSAQIASLLINLKVSPGERISIQIEKSPESLFLYLACLRAGLIYHPLNPGYTENELEFFINNAEPTVIICDPKNFSIFDKLAKKIQLLVRQK